MILKTTPLYVRFSKKMRPDSLKRAFSISPAVDYRIFSGRQNRQSDFDLLYVELIGAGVKNPLMFDTQYRVTISTAASDFENLSMEEDYEFAFSTGKASINATLPGNGETNALVNLQNPVYIYFNARIDPESINEDTVSFSPSPETIPDFRIHDEPETGWSTLRIYVQLNDGTRYTLRLDYGIQTDTGYYISNTPYTLRFTTAEKRDLSEWEPR